MDHHVAVLNLESFYREQTDADRTQVDEGEFNFDHPDAFDFKRLETTLDQLAQGEAVDVPIYDFRLRRQFVSVDKFSIHCECIRNGMKRKQVPVDVLILEGMFVLYKRRIRERLSLKVQSSLIFVSLSILGRSLWMWMLMFDSVVALFEMLKPIKGRLMVYSKNILDS